VVNYQLYFYCELQVGLMYVTNNQLKHEILSYV